MARFIAEVEGQAGAVTRIGSVRSGIRSHTRGWHVGVRVSGFASGEIGDEFHIYATRGSNGYGSGFPIGVLRTNEDGRLIFEPSPEALGERGGYVAKGVRT